MDGADYVHSLHIRPHPFSSLSHLVTHLSILSGAVHSGPKGPVSDG